MLVDRPRAAYIHVPFCKHRCGYCDFAVVAGRDDLVGPYLNAIAAELSWLREPQAVDTLYFGGGTPSYLAAADFDRLSETVLRWHPLASGYEWTVEANPEHVTKEFVDRLAARGVTRVSLGLQSFDDAKLRALDRNHTGEEAQRCVRLASAAGLATSLDLIFGTLAETLDLWLRDLRQAISLEPSHISTYGLTYERGTQFTLLRDRGEIAAADEEVERAMYATAIDMLAAAGYEHYEVSNFARPGRRSRHNEVYWAGAGYFAAGPGAARYVDGVRETNHKSTVAYIQHVLAGRSPVAEREELPPEQRARERLILGLRRLEGVERNDFHDATGYNLDALGGANVAKFVELGLLADDGVRVRLTREGLMVSDAMWPEFL